MTGTNRDYVFRLRGDSEQLARSAEAAAQAVDHLAGSAGNVAREQAAARAAGDSFIAGLQRQAQSIGKTSAELMSLRAAELGVADAARPLIDQIQARTAAQEAETAAAARAAAGQRALENIRAAAQAQDRQAFQAKQQFIDQLQREADAIGKTRSQLLEQRAAQLGVTAQAQPLIQRLQAGEKAFAGFGRSGKISGQELVQVGYQLNDFAVQVASGQSAVIALVQQGSQLSGTFGGAGNAVRALASLLTPMRVVIGGVAAGIGLLAMAYAHGYKEQAAFENGMRLTGNRAGTTKGQVDEYARSIEAATDLSIAASREVTAAVTASGAFGPGAIEQVALAAGLLAERTGRSADDVVKDFARMRDGVAKWAAEANRSYNFLTAEQYKHIRALEQQGRADEAAAEAARLLAEQLGQKTPTELGFLDRALVGTKKLWSDFWDAAFDIGRPDTVEQKIAAATEQVLELQRRQQRAPNPRRQQRLDAARQRLEDLRAQQVAERQAAQQQATDAKTNAEAITRTQKDYVDGTIALQRAQQQRSAGLAELGRTREYEANEEGYARLTVGFSQYIATRARLERQALNAKLAGIDQELAAERQRVVEKDDSAEGLQKQARLVEIEARRAQILQERVRLERQIRAQFGVEDTSTAGRIRAAQAEAEEEEARALAARRQAAAQAAGELFDGNRQLSASLIRDAEQRGQALIEIERQQLVQRLDLYALEQADRQRAQDSIAEYVLLRQRQLTEELKPEWRRMLDEWADVQANMKRASDEFQTDFLLTGRETWREFVRTGELSVARLGDLLVNTLADQVFERSLAPAIGELGNTIARGIGLGAGTQAPGQVAQQAALAASTGALAQNTTAAAGAALANDAQALAGARAAGVLDLLGIAAGEAGRALAALALQGGAGSGSLLSGLVSAVAGAFTGGGSATASPVYSPALPEGSPLPPLNYGGGRARGGDVRPGNYYEVVENGPEMYEDRSGRTFMLNPAPGRVSPMAAVRAAGGGERPIAFNLKIEGAPSRPEVSQRRNSGGDVDVLVRFKEQLVRDVAGDIRGGQGPVASALQSIGVGRQAALR